MRTRVCLLTFYAALWICQRAGASETPDAIEQDGIQECRKNLHLIYEAIEAYRRVNKDLPNELAELAPRFLSEVYLVCPEVRRLGLTSADLVGWGAPGSTSYTYEFSPRPIPPIISGGAQRSMRDWKQLQMGLIGSDVAMVRCQTHEKATLNLSFGGRIFDSEHIDWENEFTDLVDRYDFTFARRFAAYTVAKTIVVPARSAQAAATMTDLSAQYNVQLDEIWPSCEPLRPLSSLPVGVAELNKTGFDVRGAIQLGALRPGLVPYPKEVTNIVIGLHGRGVHMLVATVYAAAPATPVAECIFHLADGRAQRLRLHYGTHLAACIAQPDEPAAPLSEGKLAWSATLSDGRIARLYQCEWDNPAADQAIESVDFLARAGNAGPILVALSIEPSL